MPADLEVERAADVLKPGEALVDSSVVDGESVGLDAHAGWNLGSFSRRSEPPSSSSALPSRSRAQSSRGVRQAAILAR